jgi:hypothetical protein
MMLKSGIVFIWSLKFAKFLLANAVLVAVLA